MNEFVVKLSELLSISINDLPLELKFRILSLLPIKSVLKMSSVSSLWRDITLDDQLWRSLVKQHFPTSYGRGLNGEDWKSIYKRAYRSQKLLQLLNWQSLVQPKPRSPPAYNPIPYFNIYKIITQFYD